MDLFKQPWPFPQEQCHTMHHCMLRTLLGLLCRQGEVIFKQQEWSLNKNPTNVREDVMTSPHKWLFSNRVYSLVAFVAGSSFRFFVNLGGQVLSRELDVFGFGTTSTAGKL